MANNMTKAEYTTYLVEHGMARAALRGMSLAALKAHYAEAVRAAATTRPLPAADEEGWLGQILEGDNWLDYARGFEAESRRWQAEDPQNRRIVHWIDKSIMVDADQPAPAAPTRATLAQEAEALGITVRKSWSIARLQQEIANASCGGCDNGEHCGSCECCTPEQPAAAEEPAKAKRARNSTVQVDGFTVRIGATCLVHDAEGKRIAIIRRDAVPALSQAVAEKVLRVQTAYAVDEKSIGWVRNGESLAKVAKILKKALAK